MAFDPTSGPTSGQGSDPTSGPARSVPWGRVAVVAGVGLVGLLVALAVLAPVPVLGGLLWLVLLGLAGWRLAVRTWERDRHLPDRPDATHVEALAEVHRAAARERHARTLAVVSAGLVGPGFSRGDGDPVG